MIAAIASILATGCSKNKDWTVTEGVIWHTTYRIVYQGSLSLSDSVLNVLGNVEMSLSPFRDASLVSRINRAETDSTDAMLRQTFDIALHVNRASHGRFDPTVAPLINLWGFGTDSIARKRAETDGVDYSFTVTPSELDSALSLVGIAECYVENGVIHKKHPLTTFNFSAIAKGYGCDMVAEMLKRNGVENYLVEIGGEIAAGGKNRQGNPWKIQIDAPVENPAEPIHSRLRIISIENGGIATSGNYRNFHETRRYGKFGHTIDPLSGYPVSTPIVSATVIAPTCAEADAWATACMATPDLQSAIDMIRNEPDVEALLVVAKGDSLRTVTTSDCQFQ